MIPNLCDASSLSMHRREADFDPKCWVLIEIKPRTLSILFVNLAKSVIDVQISTYSEDTRSELSISCIYYKFSKVGKSEHAVIYFSIVGETTAVSKQGQVDY